MNKLVFLVLLASGVAVQAEPTQVDQCRSRAPLPLYAQVSGCVTPPCHLHQLLDARMRAIFEVPRDSNELTAKARAYLGIIPINYPLGDQSKACDYIDHNCPIQGGTVVDFNFGIYIEPFFPVGTSVDIEFYVEDSHGQVVVCMRIPVRIVHPVAAIAAEADVVEHVKVQHLVEIEENKLM